MSVVQCHYCEKFIDLDFIDAIEFEGEYYHDTCLIYEGIEELERVSE